MTSDLEWLAGVVGKMTATPGGPMSRLMPALLEYVAKSRHHLDVIECEVEGDEMEARRASASALDALTAAIRRERERAGE